MTVRRRSDEDTLVSLEDEAYVRQGLWLQLESARLALLRQNDAAFHGALNRAELTLSQYFDGTSPRVVSMTKDLQNLASVALTSEWPDVSGPWVALQRIRTVQKAADDVVQPEAMVAEPAPESDAVSTAGDADE